MVSSPITSRQIKGEKVEVVTDFLFLGSKITVDGNSKPWNQKTTASWQEINDKPRQCVAKKRHYSADKGQHCQGYGPPSGHVWLWELDRKEGRTPKELMPSNCGAEEDPWKSLGKQDHTSQSQRKTTPNTHWKDWCWSWSSLILVIWCEQTTLWKRAWRWERLRAEGEEGVRRWDGWMALPLKWTWPWANFRRWWGTGGPGALQSKESETVGQNWATEQQKV